MSSLDLGMNLILNLLPISLRTFEYLFDRISHFGIERSENRMSSMPHCQHLQAGYAWCCGYISRSTQRRFTLSRTMVNHTVSGYHMRMFLWLWWAVYYHLYLIKPLYPVAIDVLFFTNTHPHCVWLSWLLLDHSTASEKNILSHSSGSYSSVCII